MRKIGDAHGGSAGFLEVSGVFIPDACEDGFEEFGELFVGGGLEVELVGLVEVEAGAAERVAQGWGDIEEGVLGSAGAIIADERVVFFDTVPVGGAVGRGVAGEEEEVSAGEGFLEALGEGLEAFEDAFGRIAGLEVVGAAVVDEDAGLVGEDELIEAEEEVGGFGAAEGAVADGERCHGLGQVIPEAEDGAADEEDFARTGGIGLVGLGEFLEIGIEGEILGGGGEEACGLEGEEERAGAASGAGAAMGARFHRVKDWDHQ
jgi:hypothetical protein